MRTAVAHFWRAKLGRIAASPKSSYVETSHLLMKAGLVEKLAPLTARGTVHLSALERDPYATIVSFRNRFDFWDKANRWLWYLDPDYPRNVVPSGELFAHGINGLCLWYILGSFPAPARTGHRGRACEAVPASAAERRSPARADRRGRRSGDSAPHREVRTEDAGGAGAAPSFTADRRFSPISRRAPPSRPERALRRIR